MTLIPLYTKSHNNGNSKGHRILVGQPSRTIGSLLPLSNASDSLSDNTCDVSDITCKHVHDFPCNDPCLVSVPFSATVSVLKNEVVNQVNIVNLVEWGAVVPVQGADLVSHTVQERLERTQR